MTFFTVTLRYVTSEYDTIVVHELPQLECVRCVRVCGVNMWSVTKDTYYPLLCKNKRSIRTVGHVGVVFQWKMMFLHQIICKESLFTPKGIWLDTSSFQAHISLCQKFACLCHDHLLHSKVFFHKPLFFDILKTFCLRNSLTTSFSSKTICSISVDVLNLSFVGCFEFKQLVP